jgi:hypothetical protein
MLRQNKEERLVVHLKSKQNQMKHYAQMSKNPVESWVIVMTAAVAVSC